LVATFLAGAALAPGQDVIAPETDALEIVRRAVQREAFGPLDTEIQEADVRLNVNGDRVMRSGALFLVEPGETVDLEARLEEAAQSPSQPTLDDVALFRQSRYTEISWEAEPDDYLVPGGEGKISWRAGGTDGRASYLTASMAELRIDRPARLAATPSEPAPAVIRAGKKGVLLLPGVPFDRNGDGILQGQNIGIYPNEAGPDVPQAILDRREYYRPPMTFYRLDERTREARVTPRLTLEDLVPPVFPGEARKDDGEGPRFAAISPRLVRFLKAFEAKLAEKNLDPARLEILRGFVSPTERRRLERQDVFLAEFSRFQYGDAAAMILEAESAGEPEMADLNDDGSVDIADSEILAGWAKETMDELGIYGGLGIAADYQGPGPAEGTPYVHVDLRGWYAPFREE